MTQPGKFKNESQDARRRDQHNEVHPFQKKKSENKVKDKSLGKK